MPVTPLTPLRGACPAGVAHAPHRCASARCPHAPRRRLADSNLRRAHATGSEQILPPLESVVQPRGQPCHQPRASSLSHSWPHWRDARPCRTRRSSRRIRATARRPSRPCPDSTSSCCGTTSPIRRPSRMSSSPPPAGRCSASIRARSRGDRKSTRLNSSHLVISYAVFCLKKKKKDHFAAVLADQHHLDLAPCDDVH